MKKKRLSLKMPKGYSKIMHAAVIGLSLFGVLMIISASMTSTSSPKSLFIVGAKEMVFVVVSYLMMVYVARNFSMDFFRRNFYKFLTSIVVLLGATLFFPEVNGAKAWINLKVMGIQPSEFAKIFIILMIAYWLGDRNKRTKLGTWDMVRMPLIIILGIVGWVVIPQHDLGSGVVIFGIAYLSFLIPSHPRLEKTQKIMAFFAIIGIVGLVLIDTPAGLKFMKSLNIPSYMLGRFETSADPFKDRYGNGWQIFNGMVAMFKGGAVGKGYGNSVIKYGYLPEAHTDFILAIIIEELGMFGLAILLIGYGLILTELVKFALFVPKESDKIILMGTSFYFMIHFVFNIGGLTALIPLTGVPLLLVSKGGSSRMAIMVAIGLTQNVIARYNSSENKLKRTQRSNTNVHEVPNEKAGVY